MNNPFWLKIPFDYGIIDISQPTSGMVYCSSQSCQWAHCKCQQNLKRKAVDDTTSGLSWSFTGKEHGLPVPFSLNVTLFISRWSGI